MYRENGFGKTIPLLLLSILAICYWTYTGIDSEEAVAKRAKLTKMITTTPNKDSVVPYPKQTKQEKAIEKPKIYSIEEYATQSGLAYLCAEYFPNRKKVYRSIGKHYKTLALKQGHKRDEFESMAGVTALTFSNFDKSSLAIVCKDLRLTDLPKL